MTIHFIRRFKPEQVRFTNCVFFMSPNWPYHPSGPTLFYQVWVEKDQRESISMPHQENVRRQKIPHPYIFQENRSILPATVAIATPFL